jgi:hypothetical protein
MWLRDPGAQLPRTQANARSAAGSFNFAGHTDWRLPRITGNSDRACEDVGLFVLESTTSTGCVLNELARLREGWGVTPGAPAPFVVPAGAVWFDNGVIARVEQSGLPVEIDRPTTFSFATGALTVTPPETQAVFFPVRDLDPGELPRAHNVVADPDRDVVVRFREITGSGRLLIDRQDDTPDLLTPSSRTLFRLNTTATFDSSPADAVVVCLRYSPGDIPGATDAVLRVGQVQAGRLRALPLVEGYPDALNHVVCGQARSLGDFRVMSTVPLSPFPF